jgi:hypothetical protein
MNDQSLPTSARLKKTELKALAQQYLEKAEKTLDSGRNIKSALVDCEQALKYAPKSAEAHNLRGLILDALGETDEAILAYQEAIHLKPDFADAKSNLEDAEAENQNFHQINVMMKGSSATTQIAVSQKRFTLEKQIKGGISWFFWIAGLSLLNSVIFLAAGGSIRFLVGLGTTWFIDSFMSALARNINSGTGTVIRVIGFGLDFLFAGIFVVSGVLGQKRFRWAIITGMVLYALDGLISLAFRDWKGAIFHAIALIGLWSGLRAINSLALLEKSLSSGDMASLQKLIAVKHPTDPATHKRNIKRFVLIIIVPIVLLFGFMFLILIMTLLVSK